MKKILLAIILSMLVSPGAGASEIFGQISTNPNAPSGQPNNPPVVETPPIEPIEEQATSTAPAVVNSSGAVILPAQNRSAALPEEIQATASKPVILPQILGVKTYSDGTLLRGADKKIYLIQGRVKKQIINLAELKKYSGRVILKAAAEELAGYQTREHLDTELIRQKGDAKIYVIIKGVRQHILNLEELRAHYFGLEIFNLSREQMAPY